MCACVTNCESHTCDDVISSNLVCERSCVSAIEAMAAGGFPVGYSEFGEMSSDTSYTDGNVSSLTKQNKTEQTKIQQHTPETQAHATQDKKHKEYTTLPHGRFRIVIGSYVNHDLGDAGRDLAPTSICLLEGHDGRRLVSWANKKWHGTWYFEARPPQLFIACDCQGRDDCLK